MASTTQLNALDQVARVIEECKHNAIESIDARQRLQMQWLYDVSKPNQR
jgi:hypothetical protein